ncbi:TIGR03960 family B12-binding radical SAM protein [Ruminococcaceae bacterium OttesenSCG-928-L11]|nr:TIGR03960 family B12-binding radical SAM protein [Ruminococcaceae bacterium OttesenSCG-928-L11]
MLFDALQNVLEKVQKPARYIGGELNSVTKDKEKVDVRYAFCFPDVYEIGMSHLGMKILYSLKNAREDTWCERVFAPADDMEALMRENDIPLYGLESLEPIRNFDMIGFTLQYEMCYTTVLNMLDLAGLPVRSSQRTALAPIVMAGGPCACNPEPMADFIDLFVLGEGEEVNLELIDLYKVAKQGNWTKQEYLRKAAQIQGVYVPSLYAVSYREDGTIAAVTPEEGATATVRKRIIADLDSVFFPESFVVPNIEVVHDRSMLEVLRGCIRGCRFCQAGFIYRPFREKRHTTLNKDGKNLTESSGYDEISLTSLSTSDYSELEPLLTEMIPWTSCENVGLSLPSLRIDNFSPELLEQIAKVRKSGLTFAPEAGTQRMRDVINKNITEDEVMQTCRTAFEGGYTSVKLYFMLGLPTETMDDVKGIADLAQQIVDLFYSLPERPKGKGVNVTISAACFVPKPFTPFEFEPQDTIEEFHRKQEYLKSCIRTKKINYKYHSGGTSMLEAVLARGDRRLCAVVEGAWKRGSRLDSWSEFYDPTRWDEAMAEQGLDYSFYANRRRDYDEISPWNHLDYGVSKQFLIRENKLAHADTTTPNCREKCAACGASGLYGEKEVLPPCRVTANS